MVEVIVFILRIHILIDDFIWELMKELLLELIPFFIDWVLMIELMMYVSFWWVDSPYLRDNIINKVKFLLSPVNKETYNNEENNKTQ